ncbi:MAG TPA: tetratricopeptide repeat protein [Egibacteraceae bacterium]|nr:tetratricopeptide repeat protein [Egibacteraceae bacterium]
MSEHLVYTLYQEGRSRLDDGDPGGAAEILELAVEREPAKASLHETLGRAYFASGRLRLALAAFESALGINPSDDYAHFGAGRCFERRGQLLGAAKHFKLACALADRPHYADALERVQDRLREPGA